MNAGGESWMTTVSFFNNRQNDTIAGSLVDWRIKMIIFSLIGV